MENIFLELVNLSIGASVAIVLVLILRLLLKKAPKSLLCILWLIVGFKLIFPISIEAPFSIMPKQDTVKPENFVLTVLEESIRSDVEIDPNDTVVNDENLTFTENTKSIDLTSFLTTVWCFGIIALVTYSLVGYIRLRYTLRNSEDFDCGIKISKNIKTPFVMGFIEPKIYIPNNMDESQLIHVIAHEKCHIRHKDHLLKPIAYLLLSIHWFNPIVWVAYIFFCRDLELFCDESVIKKLDKEERRAYSKALLSCSTNNYISAVSPIAFGELCVKERVEKIMTYRKPSFWIVILAVVAVIVTVVCVITGSSGTGKPLNAIYNYQIMAYRYTSDDFEYSVDKLPKIRVSDDIILSYRFNDYAEWNELGKLEPVELTEENFDDLFPGSGYWKMNTNATLIRKTNTKAFEFTTVSDKYTDHLYLIYEGGRAFYDVIRIDNETSEVVVNWLMLAHPSWDSTIIGGATFSDAIKSAILEHNEGRLEGDFAYVSAVSSGASDNDETKMTIYSTYLYKAYDVETQISEQLYEQAKMTFDVTKDEYGIYQFALISYELLDPAKLNDYKTSSGDSAFKNHDSEPSDLMIRECDNQFAEYLEYLEKYQ